MEFVTVIKNECNKIVAYCSNYTQQQIDDFLLNHPECYITCELIN